jgi:hypothetical protein
MAQINKPNTYFNPVLYTGNGGTQSVTGVNFQPDFVWLKERNSNAYNHNLFDVVRGVLKTIQSNNTGAEQNATTALSSFNADGFTMGTDPGVNENGTNFVSWNWKAGGTAVSNTDGSITSSVSANTTAGFSVATYTGNGTSGSTIGHGLTSVPSMIITKRRDSANGWGVYHQSLGTGKELYLNYDFSEQSSNFWITTPTTSVFSVSSSDYVNLNNATYVAYCFAEKKGFSKFGSYTGNGNADGPFIYTGFKPAFIMAKRSSATGDWVITDVKRNTYNPLSKRLFPNQSLSESTTNNWYDVLSNGFKARIADGTNNGSGSTYIYMAFAENPLVGTNNVPATAR